MWHVAQGWPVCRAKLGTADAVGGLIKIPTPMTATASDATPPQAAIARKSRRGPLAAVASLSVPIIVCEASRSWFDKVSSMGPSPPSRSNRVEEANENAPPSNLVVILAAFGLRWHEALGLASCFVVSCCRPATLSLDAKKMNHKKAFFLKMPTQI